MKTISSIRRISVLAILTLAHISKAPGGQSAGVLLGRLQTEDGKPVGGALVTAHLKAKTEEAVAPVSSRSTPDGSFSFSGLTSGDYQVCVHDTEHGLLDPCRWSMSPPSGRLGASGEAQVPMITLKKGRLLQVRFIDAAGVIAADKGGAKLLVGVWRDNGLFVSIPLKTTDSKGRTHALYVPTDKPLQLSVTSTSYLLADDSGNQADGKKGLTKQLEVTPGDSPITVTYRATGINK